MKQTNFNLICHSASPPCPAIRIDGRIQRSHDHLAIAFVLQDPAERIPIPGPAIPATRTRGLWERTCLECFVRGKDAKGYWEINLSPTGDWNVYRFDDYRLGMLQEAAIEALPVATEKKGATLEIRCDLNLSSIINPRQPIKVGLSAVIQDIDGKNSYWALAHPGPQPDFHHAGGFVLAL